MIRYHINWKSTEYLIVYEFEGELTNNGQSFDAQNARVIFDNWEGRSPRGEQLLKGMNYKGNWMIDDLYTEKDLMRKVFTEIMPAWSG